MTIKLLSTLASLTLLGCGAPLVPASVVTLDALELKAAMTRTAPAPIWPVRVAAFELPSPSGSVHQRTEVPVSVGSPSRVFSFQ